MFDSLRSRLLLSYGILIAFLVILIGFGSFSTLLKNPQLYEAAAQQLRTAQQDLRPRYTLTDLVDYDKTVDRIAKKYGVRAIISAYDGDIVADSGLPEDTDIKLYAVKLDRMAARNEVAFIRDRSNGIWLALADQIDPDTVLILAVRRPRLGVVTFFTSELLRPFLLSGLAGLVIAVLLALLLSRWISAPVRKIESAAHSLAAGQRQLIPLEGPREMKDLAVSFNRMSDQVLLARQAQQELVANVSHELKTPLTSIQGFSQAVIDGVIQSSPDLDRTIRLIHTEANRMSRLVQDLVVLARLEAGQEFHFERVDARPLLMHLFEKFQLPAVRAGLTFTTDIVDLPPIRADGDRLAQVISNLLDNAVKYTPSGGTIHFSAHADSSAVEIRIADDGPGIPPEEAGHIFDRFYRVDSTREKSGSGLGLAISRQIVLAHGGELRYEPVLPHGSAFILRLPLGNSR